MTIEVNQSTVRHLSDAFGKKWGISYPDFMPGKVVVHRMKWNTENIDVPTLQHHLIGDMPMTEVKEEFMHMLLSDDGKYVSVWGIMDAPKWRIMTKIAKRKAEKYKAERILAEVARDEKLENDNYDEWIAW